MKKYAVPIIVVLAVLALTLSTFSRAADRAGQRGSMRERMQNMSEEERAKFIEQMRARGGSRRGAFMSPENQQKAIKTIEEQLVKLKAVAQMRRPQGGADVSEEERNKFRTAYNDRRTALRTIVAQVALLEGRTQPTEEGARFMIINTMDLKPIQEAATKEKAAETGKLLQRMMARGTRGFGGGRQGGGRGQRPQ